MVGCVIVGALFFVFGRGVKVIPGGPFVSITGDVIPISSAIIAIYHGLICLRSRSLPVKLSALTFILLSTVGLGLNIRFVLSFWLNRYARGDLIGAAAANTGKVVIKISAIRRNTMLQRALHRCIRTTKNSAPRLILTKKAKLTR